MTMETGNTRMRETAGGRPQDADKVLTGLFQGRQQMVHLLPLFSFAHKVKDKSKIKTQGSRPPTAPDSFTGRKESAEKGLRCAGHVWLDISATSFRPDYKTNQLRFPCRIRGSCEPLLLWRIAELVMFFRFSLVGQTERSGPLTQGRVPTTADS